MPQEVLDRCLDAARLAPSSSNLRPWEFVIIRDPGPPGRQRDLSGPEPAEDRPVLIALVTHRDTWRRNQDEILRSSKAVGPCPEARLPTTGRSSPGLP
ncbi:MAG: nitroreductase family protein [Holophagaceae bacterium]|uniref:Nitroreductase family protein n=1 Tax=Candidatus Geothrix skivensis TaxID=2954439 RepID=A0A9D7SEW6_9BACT|nr:nitroreductase family protein [Candidatus Geothrix skivensis]